MGRIVRLDQNMVNMIAAGEVIERPASAVKELMENSIDAGATAVVVTVEDGGRKLISITDNGEGMDRDDLAAAFESHATSKIRDTSDLSGITTLGFRGEALASIASIAHVRAVSRTPQSDQANCIEIDCGDRQSVGPCSGDVGTTIQVRDLFYKTPARRKFLRTANTEMGHITEQFTRIALPKDQLGLTLIHNGRELYRLSGSLALRQRIAQLFPMLEADDLVEASTDEKGIRIRALLGHPSTSRTNNRFQYAFLNGRFIRDKFISHAIKEAYRGLLEPNRFPVVFLFIQMPYDEYDVNVHPTKTEVRFYNSNLVHSQILATMREKLLGTDLHMPARLPSGPAASLDDHRQTQRARRQEIADAMADFFKQHRPAHRQQQFDLQAGRAPHDAGSPQRESRISHEPAPAMLSFDGPRYLQIHDSYIVEQTDDGFVIIDQHALHEAMLYEMLRERAGSGPLESQRLLLPETFDVTDAQADAIEDNAEVFRRLGVELAPFGPRTYAVQAFPTLLAKVSAVSFVQDLVDLLATRRATLNPEDMLDEVLNMTACKAAIKAGQKLTESEIQQLLADRQRYESTSRCPHGRPTTIAFSMKELEKQFKRT
ncbi:DNA mismatch repair endonuclease MutL [Anaerobaca lacustris]|uniref:DNA mismatch repair protein MutL n=1 Tax=Anaerobaca lacustris TaxID=3044600 RepID=A0AAW6U1L0_9BACT|nr:DNA mismatch repair endonuclease MutL [Sedimentisphaerales bacterium M17dextr]